jgi:catechol 2,3-dioxygenase-like lactoylglutathione lyase family enzyme
VTANLDHVIVPARDRDAAAERLAGLLGVHWGRASGGPFTAVYVNDGLTLDFANADGAFPPGHFAFLVPEAEFEAVLARIVAAGIPYRSTPLGPADGQVGHHEGGRIAYWNEPDGHVWEILTRSYARRPADG